MASALFTYAARFSDAEYEKKAKDLIDKVYMWQLVPRI
jgi:hypothetical protein